MTVSIVALVRRYPLTMSDSAEWNKGWQIELESVMQFAFSAIRQVEAI